MRAGNATTIKDENGTLHHITADLMKACIKRGEKYLAEAVRFSAERDAGLDISKHERRLKRNQIPEEVWFPIESSFSEDDMNCALDILEQWAAGTLDNFGGKYAVLSEDLDLDHTYLLFGVPITDLSVASQEKLQRLGAQFADRNLVTTAEDDDD